MTARSTDRALGPAAAPMKVLFVASECTPFARVHNGVVERLRGVPDTRGRAREPFVLQLPHELREAATRFQANQL